MNAAWVLIVAPVLAALDAATGRRAARLWRGIPEHVDRRLANRCDWTEENTYYWPDSSRRACRACTRRWGAESRARREAS